jgi:hypothetical protein
LDLPDFQIGGDTKPHLVTKAMLAKRYSCSTRTIQAWVAARIIPFVRTNPQFLRFNPAACDRALARFGGVAELPVTFTKPRKRKSPPKKPVS